MKIALDYHNQDGYVSYDEASHSIEIVLEDEVKRAEVIAYLAGVHEIRVPGQKCNEAYITKRVEAKNNREEFEKKWLQK